METCVRACVLSMRDGYAGDEEEGEGGAPGCSGACWPGLLAIALQDPCSLGVWIRMRVIGGSMGGAEEKDPLGMRWGAGEAR